MTTDEARPATGISRRNVLRSATLAAAGVATAGAISAVQTGTATATVINAQFGWAFCSRCSALWWPGGGGEHVACAATGGLGPHVIGSNYSYGLNHDLRNLITTSNPQPDWKWCVTCSELYWGGNAGICPYSTDGVPFEAHSPGSKTSYDVEWQGPNGPAYDTTSNPQGWWRYCTLCSALFWSGPNSRNAGICAFGIGEHTGGPTNYHVDWRLT